MTGATRKGSASAANGGAIVSVKNSPAFVGVVWLRFLDDIDASRLVVRGHHDGWPNLESMWRDREEIAPEQYHRKTQFALLVN